MVKGLQSHLLKYYHCCMDVDRSSYNSVKEMDPFPDLDCFEHIRKFHQDLYLGQTLADEFIKFVKRTSSLPQQLRLKRDLLNYVAMMMPTILETWLEILLQKLVLGIHMMLHFIYQMTAIMDFLGQKANMVTLL